MVGVRAEGGKRSTGSAVAAQSLTIAKTSENVERYLILTNF